MGNLDRGSIKCCKFCETQQSPAGPNGIKNFNPGIFRDGILPNPGIPGSFGTGFSNIFDPGILGKTFGIFRDFHFYFIRLSNWIIFSIFIITIVVTMHHALLPPFSGITLLLIRDVANKKKRENVGILKKQGGGGSTRIPLPYFYCF